MTSNYLQKNKSKQYTGQQGQRSVSNSNPKEVVCITTGEVFRSCSEAAMYFKIAQSSLSAHLHDKKGYETVGGLTFKFL